MYSSSLGRRHYIWPSCSRNSIRGHGKQQLSRAADGRQRLVVQLLTFPCNGNRNALFLAAVGFWHGQFLLVTVRDNQVEAADVRYIQVHFWFVQRGARDLIQDPEYSVVFTFFKYISEICRRTVVCARACEKHTLKLSVINKYKFKALRTLKGRV